MIYYLHRWIRAVFNCIVEVLKEFESESGLAINMSKSALYMDGTTPNDLQEQATLLSIPLETLPIRYLGLPLTTKNMTQLEYEPLIDKLRSRFLSWTRKIFHTQEDFSS